MEFHVQLAAMLQKCLETNDFEFQSKHQARGQMASPCLAQREVAMTSAGDYFGSSNVDTTEYRGVARPTKIGKL